MPPKTSLPPQPSAPESAQQSGRKSKVGQIWVSTTVFAVILILLIVFILQNNVAVKISYFGANGTLPFGVAMLIAAVAGSVLTLLIGSVRILQLRRQRQA